MGWVRSNTKIQADIEKYRNTGRGKCVTGNRKIQSTEYITFGTMRRGMQGAGSDIKKGQVDMIA